MSKIEKLQQMLVADPHDAFLLHAMGLEKIKAGDEPEAQRLFLEILTKNPAYVGTYYHLGRSLERTGQPVEAMAWYEKGMVAAQAQGDRHAYGELQAAYEDISDT